MQELKSTSRLSRVHLGQVVVPPVAIGLLATSANAQIWAEDFEMNPDRASTNNLLGAAVAIGGGHVISGN